MPVNVTGRRMWDLRQQHRKNISKDRTVLYCVNKRLNPTRQSMLWPGWKREASYWKGAAQAPKGRGASLEAGSRPVLPFSFCSTAFHTPGIFPRLCFHLRWLLDIWHMKDTLLFLFVSCGTGPHLQGAPHSPFSAREGKDSYSLTLDLRLRLCNLWSCCNHLAAKKDGAELEEIRVTRKKTKKIGPGDTISISNKIRPEASSIPIHFLKSFTHFLLKPLTKLCQ